jgi:hypothetical protein
MRHLVMTAIAVTAIAVSAPIWAQPAPSTAPPPGANAPAAPVQSMNRMPAGGRATSERGAAGSVTRAHHRRHVAQSARTPSDNTADQLNRQELSQLPGAGNPTTMNRMSVGGRATSGGPNQ